MKRRGDYNNTNKKQTKRVGSIYFNVKDDAPREVKAKLRSITNWLDRNKVILSLSFKNEDEGYDSFIAFSNSYKEKGTDPDFIIYPKEKSGKSKKPSSREDDLDELDLDEDDSTEDDIDF